jgi:hypothetical protein
VENMAPVARSLRRRGRLIDPVKENPNNKMLKKYTKYAATAFAVASLSTFMIGCGGEGETSTAPPASDPEVDDESDPSLTNNTDEIPAPTDPDNPSG